MTINFTARKQSPAAARNREPIAKVLLPLLANKASVLEIASGTGEHAVHMAAARPDIHWQPSDPDPNSRESIASWVANNGISNVALPLDLDVRQQPWPVGPVHLVFCCNMIHITPWICTEALVAGANDILKPDGILFLYGPFSREGAHTALSNKAFDQSLRGRNPLWGVRDLEAVTELANASGLAFKDAIPMPANNFCVLYRKREDSQVVWRC
ncbi:MAG: DUF938 domain-containing protein [Rhodospirillaceae bacterium]|nr:DUF938 domain-containing protein [Rhodospirillaceae bacterium]